MVIEDFDPAHSPLNPGINLIEASAGTGKTYTIAMLVMRMVVELGIPVDQILVVTFTKAATDELKQRIRARLSEAKNALKAGDSKDANLSAWLHTIELPEEAIVQRLESAILDIDQAGIFTIHGFCQRVLSEHALASGQLFKVELSDDVAAIQQSYADDFWRREVQNRPTWEAAVLTSTIKTPDQLLESIGSVSSNAKILPITLELETALSTLMKQANVAADSLAETVMALAPHVEAGLFNKAFTEQFPQCAEVLGNWLKGHSALPPEASMLAFFSQSGLLAHLNGHKFRKTNEISGEDRKLEFLASLRIDTQPFDLLSASFENVAIALRKKLLEGLQQDLNSQLEQMNLWSFDSLISFLADALRGDRGNYLIEELRRRFSAALIDEFQDTDAQQWHIFSALFAVPSHYLMLVGDPKQAIYKFRGADIFSYLTAQRQAEFRYTLKYNWRSHPDLVKGINCLFDKANIFLLNEISFSPSSAALTPQHGELHDNGKPLVPIAIWQLAENDDGKRYWNPAHNQAADLIKIRVVNEIVALLTADISLQPENRSLKPVDIAVLVRSNRQARAYQAALASAGVPSVLGNTESVMLSEEARQLYTLLDAIVHPGDISRLAKALALEWFDYNGQALYRLLNNENELDSIISSFARYYEIWQQKDLMPMVQTLFVEQSLIATIAKLPYAERRLTNLQHILELLQQATLEKSLGSHKTLAWLKNAITDIRNQSADIRQLRLESDADAVKVITMHRAKGLEFPVVFCPLLWDRPKKRGGKAAVVQCHSDNANEWLIDLGSANYAEHLNQAEFEQRAEDMRIAYVALTRAKYRCYVAWVDARTEAESNNSALSVLLNLTAEDFSGQQTKLQELAQKHPAVFSYDRIENTIELSGVYEAVKKHQQLSAKKLSRSLYSNWQMSSYTALSALSLFNQTPELPPDRADERQSITFNADDNLPAGPHTGNVIHELLERVPFQDLAARADIGQQRDQSCQRFGLSLKQPEVIDELLATVVSTPLSTTEPRFTLANLPTNRCLKEMPFYLAMSRCQTGAINSILENEAAFQPLTNKQLSGFLTGFIDLICEYDGNYYVMDYKTNLLENYHMDAMTDAMREHNYGLQYWLYSVVLHQYLQIRKPDYLFEQHFGGVRYLFVRGMAHDSPMRGIFADKPDLAKLDALSALFTSNHVC